MTFNPAVKKIAQQLLLKLFKPFPPMPSENNESLMSSEPLQKTIAGGNVQKSPAQSSDRLFFCLGFGILALFFLLVFSPVFGVGLLSDDWGLSYEYSKPWLSFKGHWFGGGKGHFYRPLSRIVIFYEARLFGYSGLGQHILSCIAVLGAVYLMALALFRRFGLLAALVASALFLINPNITEVVGWISSQTDIFVAFFYIVTLFFLIPPLKLKRIILSALFAVLTYLSKDTSVILGPIVVTAAVYLLVSKAVKEPKQRKLVTQTAVVHAALWLAYLLLRVVLLGKIGMPQTSFVPHHGFIHHFSMNFLTFLREYLLPFFNLGENRNFLVDHGLSLWWLPLVGIVLFVWLILIKRHEYVLLAIVWFIAILPGIVADHSWFYESLVGSERYLFLGLFFLSAAVGIAFHDLWNNLKSPAKNILVLVGAAVLIHMSLEVSRDLDDWIRCARLRDNLEEEIKTACETTLDPMIVIQALPDHIGEGYVFRNGFREFFEIKRHNDKATFIDEKNLTWEDLKLGRHIFRLNYIGEARPMLSRDLVLEKLLASLPERRKLAQSTPAIMLDFTKGVPKIKLGKSDNVVSAKIIPGALMVEVRPLDPYLIMEFPKNIDPIAYTKAIIEFEVVDSPQRAEQRDTLVFMWKPSQMSQNFPSVRVDFTIRPGIQKITFPLDKNIQWISSKQLDWVRFNLGGFYQGRIKIFRIAFLL